MGNRQLLAPKVPPIRPFMVVPLLPKGGDVKYSQDPPEDGVGCEVRMGFGGPVGGSVGCATGDLVGLLVGSLVGTGVASGMGARVGETVGESVGMLVGRAVVGTSGV